MARHAGGSLAVLLLGVMYIRGRTQELWVRWAESTNDFLRAHNRFILHVCANIPSRFRPRSRLCRVCVEGTRRRVLLGRYVRQIRLRWPVLTRATPPRENRKHSE